MCVCCVCLVCTFWVLFFRVDNKRKRENKAIKARKNYRAGNVWSKRVSQHPAETCTCDRVSEKADFWRNAIAQKITHENAITQRFMHSYINILQQKQCRYKILNSRNSRSITTIRTIPTEWMIATLGAAVNSMIESELRKIWKNNFHSIVQMVCLSEMLILFQSKFYIRLCANCQRVIQKNFHSFFSKISMLWRCQGNSTGWLTQMIVFPPGPYGMKTISIADTRMRACISWSKLLMMWARILLRVRAQGTDSQIEHSFSVAFISMSAISKANSKNHYVLITHSKDRDRQRV